MCSFGVAGDAVVAVDVAAVVLVTLAVALGSVVPVVVAEGVEDAVGV